MNIFSKRRSAKNNTSGVTKVGPVAKEEDTSDLGIIADSSAATAATAATNARIASGPVDLDVTILDDEDDNDEECKRGVAGLLQGLDNLILTNDMQVAKTYPAKASSDVFFDEEDEYDDASPNVGIPAAQLVMPDLSQPVMALPMDDDDVHSLGGSLAGPPSEINIDMEGTPTSPMRDPSVVFRAVRDAEKSRDRGLLKPLPGDENMEHALLLQDGGLKDKLLDAERLVRIILGNTSQRKYTSLEHGSILQAIKTFAVMKKELIDLRRQQEQNDGDPPAILTDLTSPATIQHASSTTPSSNPLSSVSPKSNEVQSENTFEQHKELRVTRNALVLAAKKCQSLEHQLKTANETIDRLHLEQSPNATSATTHGAVSKTPKEMEELLLKLHGVSVSTMSPEERRKYVEDMLQLTSKDPQHTNVLQESLREEAATRCELEDAKKKIRRLQAMILESSSSEFIPNPQSVIQNQLDEKDDRIAQLEANQVKLQSLLQMTVTTRSPPLQESNWTPSEWLRSLEKEHRDLADSVRLMEPGHDAIQF